MVGGEFTVFKEECHPLSFTSKNPTADSGTLGEKKKDVSGVV